MADDFSPDSFDPDDVLPLIALHALKAIARWLFGKAREWCGRQRAPEISLTISPAVASLGLHAHAPRVAATGRLTMSRTPRRHQTEKVGAIESACVRKSSADAS